MVENKVCLVVIDGWGVSSENTKGDAIYNAKTPVMDRLKSEFQYSELSAHGTSVGLPEGLMGNSEVGHLNIGAGRVVYQDRVRIDEELRNKDFFNNPTLKEVLSKAKTNGKLHLLGLVSDGGVHSHINHLFGLLEAAKQFGVPETFVHCFTDGRDTKPRSADKYISQLQENFTRNNYGSIGVIVGRYYAMDRDRRWERIKLALEALTKGVAEKVGNAEVVNCIQNKYKNDETDEFFKPILVNENAVIKDNDVLLFFNYRSDRMRQITQALGISPELCEITTPQNLNIVTMTKYKADYKFNVIYQPQSMDNVLSEWLSKKGIKQCHIAETEKYAHVTFFFNGGTEKQFEHEDRDLIPSPRVATYNLKPEMSAISVGEKVAERVASQEHEFVMCNFAPPDMVGHTGMYEEAIKGCEATDQAIGIILESCLKNNYILLVTADHGNAEKMLDEEGGPHTAHTTSPVPFCMSSKSIKFRRQKGVLGDVAPTILDLMALEKPKEMTGNTMI